MGPQSGSDLPSTIHSTPPRTVPHMPTTTFHTGAVFWQKSCSRKKARSTTAAVASMVALCTWRYGRMWVLVWVFIVCAEQCGLRHLAQRTLGVVLSSWLDTVIRVSDSPRLRAHCRRVHGRSRHLVALQIAVHHSPIVGCTGHCASLFDTDGTCVHAQTQESRRSHCLSVLSV